MTKKDLVRRLAQLTGLHQGQVRAVLDQFMGTVAECIREEDRITLRGFGSFYLQEQALRRVRHPVTGLLLEVPSRRRAAFHASPKMHQWVNLQPEFTPRDLKRPLPADPGQIDLFGSG